MFIDEKKAYGIYIPKDIETNILLKNKKNSNVKSSVVHTALHTHNMKGVCFF